MNTRIDESQVESFYRAALVGLGFLHTRPGAKPRFGPDADARWLGFAGHLTDADRLDLALRDAAVSWGAAFSASRVFALAGVAADEPFGADWPGLHPDIARRLWRTAAAESPEDAPAALGLAMAAWSVEIPADVQRVGDLSPATRLAAVGLPAVTDLVVAFAVRDDLDWREQVVAVVATPAERQLACLGAVLCGARGPTRLVECRAEREQGPLAAVQAAGVTGVDRILVGPGADAGARFFAQDLERELRG